MAGSGDYAQVSTVVRRLSDLLSLLNPVKLVSVASEVVHEISTPPPGDPEALEALAAAYRAAGSAIAPVTEEVGRIGAVPLPDAWKGGAVTDAAEVLDATARAVDRTPQALTAAADALTELATAVRDHQRRHGELRQRLRDAVHDATHAFGLPIPDPVGAAKLVAAVGGMVSGCVRVYTDSLIAADRAASRFSDIRGRARAAAAADGGLAPDDAVVLADQVVGVLADGYDDGVLTSGQLTGAGTALAALARPDRARFDDLLARACSDTERAWLLKALTAGHGLAELSGFAETVRGADARRLDQRLSLIDRGAAGDHTRAGAAVRQYEETTCGTTSLIVARAERDPLYALSLTSGDFAANFRAERDRVHEETNRLYPQAIGTSPPGMAHYLNEHSRAEYTWRVVDDTKRREVSATLREIVTAVDRGDPVPLLVGGPVPRHYVLAVGHRDGAVLVYEPTSGDTVAVPERDFLAGNLQHSLGFDHVQVAVLPRAPSTGR